MKKIENYLRLLKKELSKEFPPRHWYHLRIFNAFYNLSDEIFYGYYQYRRNPQKTDWVVMMMAYESGEITDEDVLKLFAHLIKTGQVWQLQSSLYGRPAKRLIELGYISPEGKILRQLK